MTTMKTIQVNDAPFDTVPADGSEVIQKHSRSFAVAARLLPVAIRQDVQRLYAWCRWCDDAVDSCDDQSIARGRLKLLRSDVVRIYRGQQPHHRASAWLAELVEKYSISRELPLGLLDGMEMDLDLDQFRSEEELLRYCYHAAGVVGLMLCHIFGVTDPRAMRHAKSLGMAMQLTNIARDVREDSERNRCYLPKTWLPEGVDGSSEQQIALAVKRALDLAEQYYEIGNAGIHYLPSGVRRPIRIASAVYREIGLEIRRTGYCVMQGRVVVPKTRFLTTVASAWSSGLFENFNFTSRKLFSPSNSPIHSTAESTELIMNDAKYIFYLGISLTAFMSCAGFMLVALNPKDASYAALPIVYAGVCFAVGVVTNLLAKRAEAPAAVPVRIEDARSQPRD